MDLFHGPPLCLVFSVYSEGSDQFLWKVALACGDAGIGILLEDFDLPVPYPRCRVGSRLSYRAKEFAVLVTSNNSQD